MNDNNSWKQVLEIVQLILAILTSLTTISAIIGGAWLYFKRRQRFPRAKVAHQIIDKRIANGKILLRLSVTILNQGEVLLSLKKGHAGIKQLLPCPQTLIGPVESGSNIFEEGKMEACWDWLAHREFELTEEARQVEPNEEEEFNFDFILDSTVKTVIVYSFVQNKKIKRREIGWNKATVYDLSSASPRDEPLANAVLAAKERDMSRDKSWPPPSPRDPSFPSREKQAPPIYRPEHDRQGPPRDRPTPAQNPPQSPPPPKKD